MNNESRMRLRTNEDGFSSLSIRCRTVDRNKGMSAHYLMGCTMHAEKRLQQRGLSTSLVSAILDHAECFYRQGLEFYVVGSQSSFRGLDRKTSERIRNTVLVVCPQRGEIITTYKNDKAMKHLRKKGKELKKYRA